MPIITVILVLLFAGFICWLVSSAPMIHPWFRNAIIGVIVFAALLYILGLFGVGPAHHWNWK